MNLCINYSLTFSVVFFFTTHLGLVKAGMSNEFVDQNITKYYVQGIEVAGWHWDKLSNHISVSIFIVAICIMKIGYHKAPKHLKILTTSIPESNILIIVGVIAGIIVYFIKGAEFKTMHWSLSSNLFFFILLPPIMLESAYSLYDRNFLNNLSTIIYFAVVGTVLNCLIIGFSLYAISLTPAMGKPKLNLTIDTSLLFSSIVVAVDPVAVLAIFNEIGVQPDLYFIVFGESLFNDAVTVVLYNIFNVITHIEVKTPLDIILGVVSFFTVSCGGLIIGTVFGAVCSYISKYTEHTQIIEPMVIFTTALLSYYTADLFGWSGIMAIISCGIMQAAYCFDNISKKSKITVKYFSKVMASVSEGIIFLYLGLELVTDLHYWHWGFALWSLFLCIAARFFVVFVSSTLRNIQYQQKMRSYGEMFIIAFGGLRGAVAFALADTLSRDELIDCGIEKDLYVTTTLFIIMFTCFVMGVLVKPAVRLLKIDMRKTDHQLSVFFEFNNHVMDHIGTGMEDIIGNKGNHYFRAKMDCFSVKYIRPCLQRKVRRQAENIIDIYHKVALEIHLATVELSTCHNDINRRHKLAKHLKKQIDEFNGSPEEFQKLTRPNYLPTIITTEAPDETSSIVPMENCESDNEMSLKELRVAIKVMTLSTPSRRMSTAAYHERINRCQQFDDNQSLAEEIEKLHLYSLHDSRSNSMLMAIAASSRRASSVAFHDRAHQRHQQNERHALLTEAENLHLHALYDARNADKD